MENYLKIKLNEVIKVDSSVFDFIQQFALEGFWFLDAKNTSSCWLNPKLLSVLGYQLPYEVDALTNNWANFSNEKDTTSLLQAINTLGTNESIKLNYLHKNGSIIKANCSLKLIFDSAGNIENILGANTVIEKDTLLDHTEISFHQSIGQSTINSDFLYILKTDIHGNYTYINDYFYKVFGFKEEDILGTNALLSIIPEDHAACQETVVKCFMYPKKAFQVILRKKNKNNEIVTNQWEFTGLADENGQTFEILCVGYNVSEKVKTENDLSILVSNMTDLLISVNYHGVITFVSPNVNELYLYELDEIIGKPYIDFVHDEDIEIAIEAIRKTIATGIPFTNLEVRIKKKEGDFFWTNINSSINPINKETILVINDISTKVEYLRELKQAKELLQEISEVSNVGGWEYFPETKYFFWSDISRKIYGLPFEFVPSLGNIQKFLKPKSKKTFQYAIEQAIQNNLYSDLELEILSANQQEIWLRSIIKADFTNDVCTRVYGTFQDIDQLKKAEIAREKSTKLLKHLAKQVPGILYQFQLTDDGRHFFSYLSRQLVNTPEMDLLISPEEKTKVLLNYIHPDDYQMVINKIATSAKFLTLKDIEFRVILPSQKERWLKTTSTPERLNDGVIWHGYMSDITDRKHVEQELRRTKDFLQETTQVARIGGWSIDIPSHHVYWSNMIKEIVQVPLDIQPSIAFGLSLYKEGYSRNLIKESINNCIEYGYPFDVELQIVNIKNEEIWVKIIGKAEIENGKIKRVYGILQDINQSKIAEENTKNLHRVEILLTKEKQLNLLKSRFISLTSHEFRTPLAGILGSAELLELYTKKIEDVQLKNKMQEHISHITSQVDRLTGIVADVLTLEKTAEGKTLLKLQAVAIKAFLQKISNDLYINLRDNRKLKLILPEDEKEVFTDESLLVHILNNLISNAFKYSRGINQSPEIQLTYFDEYFIIIIKDYGLGIPKKDQDHLFETFFRAGNVVSTEGTGLGLSIAKEFTEKLGGQISFESREGKGSTFTLKLPY